MLKDFFYHNYIIENWVWLGGCLGLELRLLLLQHATWPTIEKKNTARWAKCFVLLES